MSIFDRLGLSLILNALCGNISEKRVGKVYVNPMVTSGYNLSRTFHMRLNIALSTILALLSSYNRMLFLRAKSYNIQQPTIYVDILQPFRELLALITQIPGFTETSRLTTHGY
jgi:hypothetical protein